MQVVGRSSSSFCSDNSGHAWVELQIEAGEAVVGVTQAARVILPIEATAVDAFVKDLRQLRDTGSKPAVLTPAPRHKSSSLKPLLGDRQ
jgi:hypothetical protein